MLTATQEPAPPRGERSTPISTWGWESLSGVPSATQPTAREPWTPKPCLFVSHTVSWHTCHLKQEKGAFHKRHNVSSVKGGSGGQCRAQTPTAPLPTLQGSKLTETECQHNKLSCKNKAAETPVNTPGLLSCTRAGQEGQSQSHNPTVSSPWWSLLTFSESYAVMLSICPFPVLTQRFYL